MEDKKKPPDLTEAVKKDIFTLRVMMQGRHKTPKVNACKATLVLLEERLLLLPIVDDFMYGFYNHITRYWLDIFNK